MKSLKPFLLLALALPALALSAQAQAVLQLDFGPTTATGDSLQNSPYHIADSSFTGTTWNQVGGTVDSVLDIPAGGLQWSDGTTAAGVALNLGQALANSNTIDLATQPGRSTALGAGSNTGVYAGTSVGRDGIFSGAVGDGQRRAIGLQITGLSAGIYEIYVTARNTSTAFSAHDQHIYVGTAAGSGNFGYTAGLSSSTLTYDLGSSFTGSWVEGQNYAKFTVTLAEGEVLNLATDGTNGRGFLNSVQIVSVIPEPSSAGLLVGGIAIVLAGLRRRRA